MKMSKMQALEAKIIDCAYSSDDHSEPWVNVPVSLVSEWIKEAVIATIEQIEEVMDDVVEQTPAGGMRHV